MQRLPMRFLAIFLCLALILARPSGEAGLFRDLFIAFTAPYFEAASALGLGGRYVPRSANANIVDSLFDRMFGQTGRRGSPSLSRLEDYIPESRWDYEVRYVLSRLADLASSNSSDEEAVRSFLSDTIVLKFVLLILNPNIDFSPLIPHIPFNKRLVESAGASSPASYIRNTLISRLTQRIPRLTELEQAARLYPQQLATYVSQHLTSLLFIRGEAKEFFNHMGFSVDAVTKTLSDPKVGFHKGENAMAESILKLVVGYFQTLEGRRKTELIDQFLRIPNPTEVDVLNFALMNSGPAMLKAVQFFYPDIQDPLLRAALKRSEEYVTPMEPGEVRAIVDEELAKLSLEFEDVFVEMDPHPIKNKAGSVGQVHQAVAKIPLGNGEFEIRTVAIKVVRRGYLESLKQDIARMREAGVQGVFFGGFFSPLFESMLREADLRKEAQNIRDAQAPYTRPDKNVSVVKIASEDLPLTESLLILDFIPAKYSVGDPDYTGASESLVKFRSLGNLFEVWLDSALKGSGFFHGDPNGGNALITEDDKSVFADLGNVASLAGNQRDVLKLFIGVAKGNTKLVQSALGSLVPQLVSDPSEAQRLRQEVQESLQKNGVSDRIASLLKILEKRRAEIPMNIVQFLRALKLFQYRFETLQLQAKEGGVLQDSRDLRRNFDSISKRVVTKAKWHWLLRSLRPKAFCSAAAGST